MADLSWRTGSIFTCCKGLWDCRVLEPITTKHQSVFWLVSQSRRMSAIFLGSYRWIHLRWLVLTLWSDPSSQQTFRFCTFSLHIIRRMCWVSVCVWHWQQCVHAFLLYKNTYLPTSNSKPRREGEPSSVRRAGRWASQPCSLSDP